MWGPTANGVAQETKASEKYTEIQSKNIIRPQFLRACWVKDFIRNMVRKYVQQNKSNSLAFILTKSLE